MIRYAVVPTFTELYQPAALSGARERSVSSWHGMPTASVRNKLFQNWLVIANLFLWSQSLA